MKQQQIIRYLAIALLAGAMVFLLIRLTQPQPPVSMCEKVSISRYGKSWTIAGLVDRDEEVYVDTYGGYQPGMYHQSVRWFIYDGDKGRLLQPAEGYVKRSLLDGFYPAPRIEWTSDGIEFSLTEFAVAGEAIKASDCFIARVELSNNSKEPRSLVFYAAACPHGVPGGIYGSVAMSFDDESGSVVSGDSVLFSCDIRPDSVGFTNFSKRKDRKLSDVTGYIRDGRLPRARWVAPRQGNYSSGGVAYDLAMKPGQRVVLVFRTPMADIQAEKWAADTSRKAQYDELENVFRRYWKSRLESKARNIADKRLRNAYRANLAYLMILTDDGLPRPGAAYYTAMWVRDFAYISDAFYTTGSPEYIVAAYNKLIDLQQPDGGIIFKHDAADDSELDAPGQAIYAFVRRYQRTGDREFLRRVWPTIRAAAKYLKTQRGENKYTDPQRRGILPPSLSAEDIGKPNEQHYWDDFWGVRGLRDAAFAAGVLGYSQDAGWISSEAESLYKAMMSSIKAVMSKHRIDYIPNGPEDVTSSAMARGTSCGLWPCGVLDPSDPLVVRSFDIYWEKWIAPLGGGFEHRGDFWPYAGLDLANCYLMLGRRDRAERIIEWTLDHDPTHGFYSWPEGMTKDCSGLAAGDMPHGWSCASLILTADNLSVTK